tara:strand:+ start:2959 stop:4113 length:1155 start_codon:yes stop_codon:yes gene_type:complete
MNIYFLSDQFFPRTSADSEQIVSSLSGLAVSNQITLVSSKYKSSSSLSINELNAYYKTKGKFNLEFVSYWFSSIRGIEKILFAWSSIKFLKQSKPDVVITRNIPVLMMVLFRTNIPVAFESYRPWPSRNIFAKKFFQRLAKKNQLLGIILHSKFAGESFKSVGFTEQSLLVAHNAFDSKDFYIEGLSLVQIREKYDLPKDKFIVTYSGRVSPQKGLFRLIKLAQVFPEVLFVIIGVEGEGEGDVENEARNLDNIKLVGWLDRRELFQILRASDVLYIPTSLMAREKAGNTVLPLKTFMYKASGTAILGPDIDDVKEVLTHSENAFLVQPDSFEDEKNGLKELISDMNLRITLGEKAKEEMDILTWENRGQLITSFLQNRLKDLS